MGDGVYPRAYQTARRRAGGAPAIHAHLHRDLEVPLLLEGAGGGGGGQARRSAVVARAATAAASAAGAAGVSLTFELAVAVDALAREGISGAPGASFALGGDGGRASRGWIASDGNFGASGAVFSLGGDESRSNAIRRGTEEMGGAAPFLPEPAHRESSGGARAVALFRRALRAAPTIGTAPPGDGAHQQTPQVRIFVASYKFLQILTFREPQQNL